MRAALDERQRRILVAVEAKVLGRGGVSAVAAATGVSRNTIMAGMDELEAMQATLGADKPAALMTRVRRCPASRKRDRLMPLLPTNSRRRRRACCPGRMRSFS